jgi:hypothetical protein
MPTHHTLVQEHQSIVNTRDFGSARTEATLQEALAAIGTIAPVTLLLHADDSGADWTVQSPVTFPANMTVYIPAAVTVGGNGNLTVQGRLLAMNRQWYVGMGTVVIANNALDLSGARVQALEIGNNLRKTQIISVILNAVAGATPLRAPGVIPQGALLESVIKTVLAPFGTGSGLTGVAIGDTCDGAANPNPTRWGDNLAVTAGSLSDARSWLTSVGAVARAGSADLIVTPRGGSYTEVGSLRLDCTYTTFGLGTDAGAAPYNRILKGQSSVINNTPGTYAFETALCNVPVNPATGDLLQAAAFANVAASVSGLTMRIRDSNPTTGFVLLTQHMGAPTFEFPFFLIEQAIITTGGNRIYYLTLEADDHNTHTFNSGILSFLQFGPL